MFGVAGKLLVHKITSKLLFAVTENFGWNMRVTRSHAEFKNQHTHALEPVASNIVNVRVSKILLLF